MICTLELQWKQTICQPINQWEYKKRGNDAGLEGGGFNSRSIQTLLICCQSSVCLPSPSGNKFSPHSVRTIKVIRERKTPPEQKTNVKTVKGKKSDKGSSQAVASIYNKVCREWRLKEGRLSPRPTLDPEPPSLLTLTSQQRLTG